MLRAGDEGVTLSNIEYEVKSGDTLTKIANQYAVSIEEILSLNPEIKNRNDLKIGQKIKISVFECGTVSMRYDGETLTISATKGKSKLVTAKSGLPKGSPAIPGLNRNHKLKLKSDVDYTLPEHQDVRFAGPIPEATYYLNLSEKMIFQKQGGGWGVGGWILQETFWNKLFGRDGFFLHHDGGTPGTAGCIGVVDPIDMKDIQRRLIRAHACGQTSVKIVVKYD